MSMETLYSHVKQVPFDRWKNKLYMLRFQAQVAVEAMRRRRMEPRGE